MIDFTQDETLRLEANNIRSAFTALSFGMGNAVSDRQKKWLQATEKRINFTSVILGSIRNVKVLGLSETMKAMIDSSRQDELRISKKFRRIQTIRVCMSMRDLWRALV